MTPAQEVFKRYQSARSRMSQAASRRTKGEYGIAADRDYYARLWRKYEALSKRQERYLMEQLGKVKQ